MFSSVGWGEILILIVAGLVILGPERLPGAIRWVLQSLKQVRDYATGASSQLREEMGPEFDSLQEPLSQLNELRKMTPRAIVTKHLFDGDASTLDSLEGSVRGALSDVPTSGAPAAPAASGGLRLDKLHSGETAGSPAAGGPPAPAPALKKEHRVADWDAT